MEGLGGHGLDKLKLQIAKTGRRASKKGRHSHLLLYSNPRRYSPDNKLASTTTVNKLTNEMHASLSEHGVAERK